MDPTGSWKPTIEARGPGSSMRRVQKLCHPTCLRNLLLILRKMIFWSKNPWPHLSQKCLIYLWRGHFLWCLNCGSSLLLSVWLFNLQWWFVVSIAHLEPFSALHIQILLTTFANLYIIYHCSIQGQTRQNTKPEWRPFLGWFAWRHQLWDKSVADRRKGTQGAAKFF